MADGATQAILTEAREGVDARLDAWATRLEAEVGGTAGAALAYALRSPGKRVRAALVLASYRAVGGTADGIIEVAAAVETVHAYSLVHDDLPCMDDDDLRRGRPTTHVAYDVATATRAGWVMVPVAARVLAAGAEALGHPLSGLQAMSRELFVASGPEGMVGGQWLDLEAEKRELDLPGLIKVHQGKTGALIRASCALGGLAARAPERQVEALRRFGSAIGLAFQVADDVLDVTATSADLGKTAGKDELSDKSTYVRLLGVDGARAEADRLATAAVEHLRSAGVESGALGALARYIVDRDR
ncbi:MAG TPA: farnesyl diphosphate synthase [Gemmatimonadales bacterium]